MKQNKSDPGHRVERVRITMLEGDPTGERRRWRQTAFAVCGVHRRPVVASLIAAIEPLINSAFGYAWPTDDQLAEALGKRYRSAVSRAVEIADELGLIERETEVIRQPDGTASGRRRRIWPTLPVGAEAMLAEVRLKRRPKAEPKSESEVKTEAESNGSLPESHRSPTLDAPKSEPKSDSVRQYIVPRFSTMKERTPSGLENRSQTSVVDSAMVAELNRRLERIGPGCWNSIDDEERELIDIARTSWTQAKRGTLTGIEAAKLAGRAVDHAHGSWLDHRPAVARMIEAMKPVAQKEAA